MFAERVVLADGTLLEIRLQSAGRYRLALLEQRRPVVEYRNEGEGHRRRLRGRELGYEFKSVEKLRYDFERDAEDAQHPD